MMKLVIKMDKKTTSRERFSTAVIAIIFILFLIIGLFFTTLFFLPLLLSLNNYTPPPDTSVGELNGRIYKPTSEVISPNKKLPTLNDIGIEMQDYAHMSTSVDDTPFVYHSTLVLSTTDSVTNPTKLTTVVYEIFKSPAEPILDFKEKALNKYISTELDYGSKSAYWLEDNLILRYEGQLLIIYGEPSRGIIDTSSFANAMRNKLSPSKEAI